MIWAFIKYVLLLPLNLIAPVINLLLAPIVVLFANDGWLPKWLSWFQTPDNSLDGDSGWKNEHRLWRDQMDVETNPFKVYLNRVLWLYRNPMYGFDHDVLGAVFLSNATIKTYGDTSIHDGTNAKSGFCFTIIRDTNGKTYWGLLWIKQLFKSKRCAYFDLGWKLKTYSEDANRLVTNAVDNKLLAQYSFSPRFSKFE